MQIAHDCLVVAVQARKELDAALDKVVDQLQPTAMTEGVGISVTRLGPGRYEARVNSNVPPGVITESWGSCNDPR
jgi:hypothetical protein